MNAALALGIAIGVACACSARQTPRNTKPPDAGISLSLYGDGVDRYGVVDDRRWVEVAGTTILLGNIDPGASLASLVIEPIGAPASRPLHIGPCTRDRLPDMPRDELAEFAREQEYRAAERMRRRLRRPLPNVEPTPPPERRSDAPRFLPIVSCQVSGPPGRHLVRIVYVSSTLTYRGQHDITVVEPERATVQSRFAIETPPWRERAEVVIYDGIPGRERVPREITRGPVTLDGGTGVLLLPPREVTAHVRRIFTAAAVDGGDDEPAVDGADDSLLSAELLASVWATLELANLHLPPGAIRIHVDLPSEPSARWIDIPASLRRPRPETDKRPLRLPLWIDDTLRIARNRTVIDNDGIRVVEAFTFAVTNTGDTPREVWIEERARSARHRRVERPWPKAKPRAIGDVLRSVLDVKPGRTERAGYLVVYGL